MAINLGDVNFRLGADARSLGKAVAELKRFGTVVDRSAANSTKGASQTTRALLAQEKAASDAVRKVVSLNQRLRSMGNNAAGVRKVNAAFRDYNKTLTAGRISTTEFQRASTQFNNQIAHVQRNAKGATSQSSKFGESLRGMSRTAILIDGPLGGIATRLSIIASVADSANLKTAALFAGLSVGIFALIKLITAAIKAGRAFEGYENALTSVQGSQARANKTIEAAKSIAADAGQVYSSIIPTYTRFTAAAKGTNLEGAKAEKIFRQVALVAGQLQLPIEQTTGTFKALEQIISKGTVQSEELRGQLGDRLPGAFQIAARAMGVSTVKLGEMLKAGEVIADDFLPKFGDELARTFGTNNISRIDNFSAAFNRMVNSFTDLFVRINELSRASSRMKGFFTVVTLAVESVTNNLEDILKVMALVIASFTGLIATKVIAGLAFIATGLRAAAVAALGLNVALNLPGLLGFINLIAVGTTALILFGDRMGSLNEIMDGWLNVVKVAATVVGITLVAAITASTLGITGLSIALGVLRGALIRTGIGAIIVLIGSMIWWLNKAAKRVGSFGELWRLFKNVAVEAFERIGNSILSWKITFERTMEQIKILWLQLVQFLAKAWAGFISLVSDAVNGMTDLLGFDPIFDTSNTTAWAKSFQTEVDESKNLVRALGGEIDALARANAAPFKSIKALRKALAATPNTDTPGANDNSDGEDNATIPGGGSGGSGGSGGTSKAIAVLKDYNKALKEAQQNITLFNAAPAAVERLEKALEIQNVLDDFAVKFQEAGFSVDATKQKLEELRFVLENEQEMEKWAERVRGGFEAMRDVAASGVDSFVTSLGDGLMEGELSLRSLAETAREVAEDIVGTLLQLTVSNPLKNFLFDLNAPTLGGGSGALGGLLGKIFKFRNGAAFGPTGITRAANGILSRPTIMNTGGGPVLGGEAGQEAIMPLSRDSSGRLGVKAIGGAADANISGGNVYINVEAPEGSKVQQSKHSDSNGDQFIDIIISSVNNAALTGKLDNGVGAAFGLSRKTVRR